MKKIIELNTACKAIFKDGHTEEFSSVEEASKKTGITVNSIKIRANRKGAGGKDKTQFEWLDEHTRRHYQAKKSKNKGSTFESEIVHKLQDIGYPGCIRAAGESRSTDNNKIDIIDMEDELPVNIQCKYTMNTPSYFKISEECSDKSKPFCLLWKKAPEPGSISKGAVAIIPLDYFYELIKK